MIIDTDHIKLEILAGLENDIEELVANAFHRLAMDEEESWFDIHDRIKKEIKDGIISSDKKELWEAFDHLRKEAMTFSTPKQMETKLDALAKNMDAIYLELQDLRKKVNG